MNKIVAEFVAAESKDDKKKILKKFDAYKPSKETEKIAKYYKKVAERVLEKSEFPTTERARLGRILSGDMSADKRDQMQIRSNVLARFLAKTEETKEDEQKESPKEEL